jgi:hypothetical protein
VQFLFTEVSSFVIRSESALPPAAHRRRPSLLGFGVLLVASLAAWQGWGMAAARPGGQEGPLWVSESRLDDGRRLLVIVDQATRHAAIYHLDGTDGTLTLRSTRDISWDLMVGDFNAQEPKPAALRKMLQTPVTE